MSVTQSSGADSSVEALEQLRRNCQDRAFGAYGTAAIFERRSAKLKRYLRWLSFGGLIVPVVIGAAALAYGAGFKALPVLIIVGGAIGLVPLVLSVWSLAAGWPDAQEYAVTSMVANQRLYREFKALAEDPPALDELRSRFAVLAASDDARNDEDQRREIGDEERRFGMRSALRSFQRECTECKTVPVGMTPTACDACGNFNIPDGRGPKWIRQRLGS